MDSEKSSSFTSGMKQLFPILDQERRNHTDKYGCSDRGQTTIDLALAVLIFFSAVTLLTVTSPTLFFPEGISATDQTTTADKIGDDLKNTELTIAGVVGLSHDKVTSVIEGEEDLPLDKYDVDSEAIEVAFISPDGSPAPKALDEDRSEDKVSHTFGGDPESPTSTARSYTTLNRNPVIIEVTIGTEQ